MNLPAKSLPAKSPPAKNLPANRLSRFLPKRFPVGATYVVEGHLEEGHGGEHGDLRVLSRYVVLPGGRRINVAVEPGPAGLAARAGPLR